MGYVEGRYRLLQVRNHPGFPDQPLVQPLLPHPPRGFEPDRVGVFGGTNRSAGEEVIKASPVWASAIRQRPENRQENVQQTFPLIQNLNCV